MNSNLQMSGLEKASVLILSLGLKQSAKVFEHLTEEEREILGAHIIKLKHVDAVTKQRVLDEVCEIVRMQPTVQPFEPMPVVQTIEPAPHVKQPDFSVPLKWIESMDPADAASMLSSERAQNIALVLARLAPKCAADIITQMSGKLRNDVVHKLSYVRAVSDEVIEAIDETLRRKAGKQSGTKDRYTPSTLLESLGSVSEPAAGRDAQPSAPRIISSPDDLLHFSDMEIKAVLREINQDDLCQVLKVAGEELRSAVIRNLPADVKSVVEQEMNSPVQVKLRELESAQRRVVDAIKRCFGGAPVAA